MSQPRPRTAAMPAGVAGVLIFATVGGDSTRTVPSRPPSMSIRAKRERSRAVPKRPACPATPPIRRAVGSWTTPRSGGASGVLHGHAAIVSQRSVGAIRVRFAAGGIELRVDHAERLEDLAAGVAIERLAAHARDDVAEQEEVDVAVDEALARRRRWALPRAPARSRCRSRPTDRRDRRPAAVRRRASADAAS